MLNTAIVFPGQGSQTVGMGKELSANFKVAKDIFNEVDSVLNEKLSEIIFNGNIEELTLTRNAQPALMATSIALLKVLEQEKGFKISNNKFVAGHSLGEYTALCSVGSFSIATVARLLRIRGDAMQKAVPSGKGTMAAIIGLSIEDVKSVALEATTNESICAVANDNSDGQVVLSGHTEAIEKAIEIAKTKGAKMAVKLPVSAPFHCVLMDEAKKVMESTLANETINTPIIPIVANVTAESVSNADLIKKLLVEQVTAPVRWRESIHFMAANGITEIIEIGNGKVLTGLIRRIDKNIKTRNIENISDISSFT